MTGQAVFLVVWGLGTTFSLVVGGYLVSRAALLRWRGTSATATVVDYAEMRQREEDGQTVVLFHPVIEFVDAAHRKQRVRLQTGGGSKPFAQGEAVVVFYHLDDPESAAINRFSEMWLIPLLVSGGSLVMLGIGIYFLQRASWQ